MKKTKWKRILVAVGVIVLIGMIYTPYRYGVFSRVDNGWECSEDYVAEIETKGVPEKYERDCEQQGKIETISYEVGNADEKTSKVEKIAQVYLPYAYDADKTYNILYLVHGGGDDETKWFAEGCNKAVIDNLIFYGDIEPLIIVTPTFYYEDGFCSKEDGEKDWDYDQFAHEIRSSLIPAVEKQYATYAAGNVSEENLAETREHRAMAGLSMGSMHTINVGMIRCLDLFGWFGSFSGAKTEASDISAGIHREVFEEYDIKYLLVTNGKYDMSYEEHMDTMSELEASDEKLKDGENFKIVDIKNGKHDWSSWELALYDFLQVAFDD